MTTQEEKDPAWLRARAYMGEDLIQAEYARRTGQSEALISRWEQGGGMSRDKVIKVAEALDLSVHYLLTGKEYNDPGPSRPDIVRQLLKLIGWMRGESIDWNPSDPEELRLVEATPEEPTPGEDEGVDP